MIPSQAFARIPPPPPPPRATPIPQAHIAGAQYGYQNPRMYPIQQSVISVSSCPPRGVYPNSKTQIPPGQKVYPQQMGNHIQPTPRINPPCFQNQSQLLPCHALLQQRFPNPFNVHNQISTNTRTKPLHPPPFSAPHGSNKKNVPQNQPLMKGHSKSQNGTSAKSPGKIFTCKPCQKEFFIESQYLAHCKTHVPCNKPGCEFIGTQKVVLAHYHSTHGQYSGIGLKTITVEGQRFTVLCGTDPEDVAKWREARRKNYPTKANVEKRKAEQKELIEAGVFDSRGRPWRGRKRHKKNKKLCDEEMPKRPLSNQTLSKDQSDENNTVVCKPSTKQLGTKEPEGDKPSDEIINDQSSSAQQEEVETCQEEQHSHNENGNSQIFDTENQASVEISNNNLTKGPQDGHEQSVDQKKHNTSSERHVSSVGQLVEEPVEGPLPTESVMENLAVIIDEKADMSGKDGKATQLEEKVSENSPSNAGIEYTSGHSEVNTGCAEETDSNPIKALRPTKSGKSEGQEVQGNGREQGATEEDGWLSKQATGNAEESAEEHSLVPLPQKKCQFFLRGRCKLGAKCKRAHVPNRALCKNFLAGKCRKEAKCKYTHSEEARKEYTAELALEESQQRNSLLKKLLRRERDLEASLTLQAIKYIVENNFFE